MRVHATSLRTRLLVFKSCTHFLSWWKGRWLSEVEPNGIGSQVVKAGKAESLPAAAAASAPSSSSSSPREENNNI